MYYALLPVEKGGTGAWSKRQAMNNLSPASAAGDLIYYDGEYHQSLPVGAEGDVLVVTGGVPAFGAVTSGELPVHSVYITDEYTDPNTLLGYGSWQYMGQVGAHPLLDTTTPFPPP